MSSYIVQGLAVMLVVVVILYRTNGTFRYNFKFGLSLSIVMITALIALPLSLLRPRDVRNIGVVSAVWKRIFKVFGITHEIKNAEYLKSEKPYVLVSNHQSSLDIITMMTYLPDRCTALAKKELLFFGPFGPSAYMNGLVFIDRLNHEKARHTLVKTAQAMHDKNIKLWVFPEGTRNRDGKMLPFKKGAFNLAVEAQVPVVPLVMSCYRHFHNKEKKIFIPGHVIVTVLPPVSTEGLTSSDVAELTERVRNDMVEVYKSSTEEVEQYARRVGNTSILDILS